MGHVLSSDLNVTESAGISFNRSQYRLLLLLESLKGELRVWNASWFVRLCWISRVHSGVLTLIWCSLVTRWDSEIYQCSFMGLSKTGRAGFCVTLLVCQELNPSKSHNRWSVYSHTTVPACSALALAFPSLLCLPQ